MNKQVCIAGGHLVDHLPRLAIQMNNEWGKSHDLRLFSSSVFFRVIIATFPLKNGFIFLYSVLLHMFVPALTGF